MSYRWITEAKANADLPTIARALGMHIGRAGRLSPCPACKAAPRSIAMPSREHAPGRAPTWEQMDAVVRAAELARDADGAASHEVAGWEWRRRLLWVLRCSGLRVGQALRLTWDHVDLQAGEALISGDLGKSRRERSGRRVPLAPVLLEEIAGWGRREGFVLAPTHRMRVSQTGPVLRLWEAAGVPTAVWAPSVGRAKADPHHAFRKGFKSGLVNLGVAPEVRDYLVGHHRGVNEVYEDLATAAREAVALVPPYAPAPVVASLDRIGGVSPACREGSGEGDAIELLPTKSRGSAQ